MIGLHVEPGPGVPTRRDFERLQARTATVAAQELNRQRMRSRTLIARDVRRVLGITPLKRIRSRISVPPAWRATKQRLRADGLALVHIWPARYFLKSGRGRRARASVALPAGARLADSAAVGGAFVAEGSKGRDVFRRGSRPRARTDSEGNPTWLPIKQQFVDTTGAGNRSIFGALEVLAGEWPRQMVGRLERELARMMARSR